MIGIDRSSYYRSLKPRASNSQEVLSGELVRKVFSRHARRYGSRRIEAELKAEGVGIGRHRIRRLDEGARLEGNSAQTVCAQNDRFTSPTGVFGESVVGDEIAA